MIASDRSRQQPDADGAGLLYHRLARVLGLEIIEGARPVGSVVTLDALQERFAVSRTVAREVVAQLEAIGLVRSRRRVGTVVQPRDRWDGFNPVLVGWRLQSTDHPGQRRSLNELWCAVAPRAAAGAARHASLEVRALLPPLAAALREHHRAGRPAEFAVLLRRLYEAVLRSSGNELFATLAGLLGAAGGPEVPSTEESLDQHAALAEAVWRGDPDGAGRAMTAILGVVDQWALPTIAHVKAGRL